MLVYRTIGERIRARRLELGLSAEFVAGKLGKDRSTYYRYESSDIENMPITILRPLAQILGVSESWLLSGQEEIAVKRIPCLGNVPAGEPIMACENRGEYIAVDNGLEADFCLRVKGDSMKDAGINDGDIVFVRKQPVVENGEIAVVLIDDEATLKRFYKTEKGVILKPENSKYEPLFYTEEDFKNIRILGKAVAFQSRL